MFAATQWGLQSHAEHVQCRQRKSPLFGLGCRRRATSHPRNNQTSWKPGRSIRLLGGCWLEGSCSIFPSVSSKKVDERGNVRVFLFARGTQHWVRPGCAPSPISCFKELPKPFCSHLSNFALRTSKNMAWGKQSSAISLYAYIQRQPGPLQILRAPFRVLGPSRRCNWLGLKKPRFLCSSCRSLNLFSHQEW